MEKSSINELNEIIEGLHWGQVIEFFFNNTRYAFESYQQDGNNYHTLCLFVYDKSETVGTLVFADKITYHGEGDYPTKFQDNYPIEEIKEILEKEKAFHGKSFLEAFEDGEIDLNAID